MERLLLHGGRLVLEDGMRQGTLLVEDGKILAIFPHSMAPRLEGCRTIDAKGLYIAPGFIDIHVHGGGGHDFMDGTPEAFAQAALAHLRHGTTTLYPTTLASSTKALCHTIDVFRTVRQQMRSGPHMPGLHLEGPYFAPAYAGAQNPKYIRSPAPAEYEGILRHAGGLIARWSAAPELAGALAFGRTLAQNGIVAAIAHSAATLQQVEAALQNGFTHITHLYSGMSTITRAGGYRQPGVVESAYIADGLTVEIIADGAHLPPALLGMVYRHIGPARTCLVTDAMRGATMPDGPSLLGGLHEGQPVCIEDGVAKLPDKSAFAGSVATADRLLQVMVQQVGVPLAQAVQMLTKTPAQVMQLPRKGTLAPGFDADLVLLREDLTVRSVLVAGRQVACGGKAKPMQ